MRKFELNINTQWPFTVELFLLEMLTMYFIGFMGCKYDYFSSMSVCVFVLRLFHAVRFWGPLPLLPEPSFRAFGSELEWMILCGCSIPAYA